jgi:hypothetical protein
MLGGLHFTHAQFMLWNPCASGLIICKVWPQNQYGILIHASSEISCLTYWGKFRTFGCICQNTVQMQIGWPPGAHVCFIKIKGDMPWLLVETRIPSSPTCTGNLSDADVEQWDNSLDSLLNAIDALRNSGDLGWTSLCRRSCLQGGKNMGPYCRNIGPTFSGPN